jgi:hypothetical protein
MTSISKRLLKASSGPILGFVALFALEAQAEQPPYLHRVIFYDRTPFGSLAWVDAVSRDAAHGIYFIYDLSRSSCVTLPERSVYWFLINHKNSSRIGRTGFFALRIVGQSDSKNPPREILHAFRNSGWYRNDGSPLEEGPLDIDRPTPKIETFLRLHDDRASAVRKPSERLDELVQGVGVWHAKPEKTMQSSWENRSIFASAPHIDEIRTTRRVLDVRLLKFEVTGSNQTYRPVDFNFTRRSYRRLWISISSPNFDADDRDTEIRFGERCND